MFVLGSELQKKYVTRTKEEIRRRQNVFTKKSSESLAMSEAVHEIALALDKKRKAFSDGEDIAKPCLLILARSLCEKKY